MDDPEAREMSVQEVTAEVARSIPFIRGITVSGGECMLQAGELAELFRAVRQLSIESGHPLTRLIDSNGTIPFAEHAVLMSLCDGVMLDVKAWDNAVYHRLTGAKDNSAVIQNMEWLLRHDKLTELRIVCLPGMVDVENILEHIAKTFDSIGKTAPVRLLRFRPHGVAGELKNHPMPSDEQMARYTALAQRLRLDVSVR